MIICAYNAFALKIVAVNKLQQNKTATNNRNTKQRNWKNIFRAKNSCIATWLYWDCLFLAQLHTKNIAINTSASINHQCLSIKTHRGKYQDCTLQTSDVLTSKHIHTQSSLVKPQCNKIVYYLFPSNSTMKWKTVSENRSIAGSKSDEHSWLTASITWKCVILSDQNGSVLHTTCNKQLPRHNLWY